VIGGAEDVAVTGAVLGLGRVSSVALVSAIATPPTAIRATAAATPIASCGTRCQARGSSSNPSYPLRLGTCCGTASVAPVGAPYG
jgi:hypothetical protein